MYSIAKERAPRAAVPLRSTPNKTSIRARLDPYLLLGIAVSLSAVVGGIASTGAGILYFLQPAAAAIVFGGTLGILLVTTPIRMIRNSIQRVASIFSPQAPDPERLIEEIVQTARIARKSGLVELQKTAGSLSDPFLCDALLLSIDIADRTELQAALETELRLRERQGEADAKTLEVAGGFAPTVGILGTVVGLIDVLRHFSDFQAVGAGIGTAFVSTIYGLALANLVLLPLAHRIRVNVAETFETQELILEGVLCVADGLHPSLIRLKLRAYLREGVEPLAGASAGASTAEAHG